MYDGLVMRLRELASIPEHCDNVESCDGCSKEDICLSFTNERIIETAVKAADAIEELTAYVRQIEELRKDGYYLQKIEMTTYGNAIMTMPLPQPPAQKEKS